MNGKILTDELRAIKATPDGGFIIGGYSISDSTGHKTDSSRWNSYDYWVIKLDENGNLEWDKTFGGSGNDYLQTLLVTADGGYLLGGYSDSPLDGDKTFASRGNVSKRHFLNKSLENTANNKNKKVKIKLK